MICEWKKQNGLTNLSIDERHSTWESRLLVHNHSASTYCLQFCVAQTKERFKLLRWQSDELKRAVYFVILLICESALSRA